MGQKIRGAIAAGHPKTVEAGQIIFELGGNAFDAAIAAMLASFVVESTLTSAGGGGFLLAHTEDNQDILFDFFCQTPRDKKNSDILDFYPVDVNFGGQIQTFHIGLGSIAVPGTLAGIFQVHQQLGKLPFHVVAEPAINYAQNGYEVTPYNQFTFELLEPILTVYPESRKIYAPNNQLLTTGELSYNYDFVNTLNYLIEKGVKEFYQGEIAHQIVKDLSIGGYLTLEDLSHYQVIRRKPLKINYRGYELLTNPPPSSGGILIAWTLKLLEKFPLNQIKFGSHQHLQLLAEAMYLTNQARKKSYDNNIHHPNIMADFLSQNNLHYYQMQLEDVVNKWGSTTHISVIDSQGNAASVTNSNGEGSSYVIPNTGIMLNNMLGEADLNPLGFHSWPSDRRISSMMSPTIILREGKPEIVLGSGGSNRIRTAILQVICNLLDFQFSLSDAVANPRVHWENNIFSLEPMPENNHLDQLKLPESTQIVQWSEPNMFFGGVHGVSDRNNSIEAIGDPRRAGQGMIC
ncbi:gamma-glutamyltransferase [Rippkaea orientalis PCC 8801]|uniref:Glutathione hydrolase proenzyme n=1 Tax=Rippkaea orientalis (strain PCC 8801 / RF-1) TaxID=41431 RepID=B7JVN6_RIPO1|nr:gamma-glutamyltransferase [Rippkaea orientalis]ACK64607.1 gamma-glutamyltransferase [Rippkaea orientalis PCC 8801]